ncbi:uncharacterized protein Z518_03090 [Rhinocladiella mackenziei CBS 650.93]|uniref:DUF7603 domain-containing protein n=1 Tax=Rhinocladiella mackenziei CBS 650.93 TaxID=1442369 RepID=A0A0D2IR39_9EURO|nr:uncharacterized protein Z518_03090 [Rhinocladiella mackenziei CBS 650.93]KIX08434.1 hypothetical protein Z518_03090 [Rhinocladiella mackenziei CBS 650.93]
MSDKTSPSGSFASAPPPPPKEYPPLQRLPSLSNTLKPFSSVSPVRRKPLPSNAAPVLNSPERQARQQSITDSSPNQSQSKGVPQSQDVVDQTVPDTSSPTHIRRNTGENNLTTTNGSLPRISADNYTGSPKSSHKTKRSNGVSVESVIFEEDMGLKPGSRPPPLRTDSSSSTKSLTVVDVKKPQTPGSKFTSFFTRKPTASPGTESSVTDISDRKSPLPSPYAGSPHGSTHSSSGFPFGTSAPRAPQSQPSQDSIDFDGGSYIQTLSNSDERGKYLQLEAELREISTELANSIKREMDLEDLVERLQTEGSNANKEIDRTSDYFSDSGTSSIRPSTSEGNPKEEIQRIKRESEQLRAQLKAEMSQKWQNERSSRQALESHIQILEQKLSQSRRDHNQSADISARARELEVALEDAKRRLTEERQIKENFEDLLTALRVDLEQHRNERDNLRDEVVPQLRSQIEGLESSLSESQKSPYDFTRMQQEIQSLRDENAALQSARAMNMQFHAIAEEGEMVESPRSSLIQPRSGGLQRSNTIHMNRSNSRATPNRSNSLSRSNSMANRASPENQQSLADQLKDVIEQRNALHITVKYLLRRQEAQRRQFEKRLKIAEAERDRANSIHGPKNRGYEREVRTLRSEINLLRKRADDALEQKWQCEKGLSGLKMDLDRSKQETASLQLLLQARDETAPEVLSSTLEQALRQLQQQRDQARHQESLGSLEHEQELATELEMSAQRSEALAAQVRKQIQTNSDLRNRLRSAVEIGESNQQASAEQINELQTKLRKLEDVITVAQMQSETAVMKHEEEVRVLRASHNIQLMRTRSGRKTPALLTPTPRSPLSPMFVNSKKSPKLDQTTSGPGMALQQALKTEYLENKVADLEKALAEAEKEMGEVVGRMNTAQMGVAELESERDEALRQTRRLEAAIIAEREKVQALLDYDYPSDY